MYHSRGTQTVTCRLSDSEPILININGTPQFDNTVSLVTKVFITGGLIFCLVKFAQTKLYSGNGEGLSSGHRGNGGGGNEDFSGQPSGDIVTFYKKNKDHILRPEDIPFLKSRKFLIILLLGAAFVILYSTSPRFKEIVDDNSQKIKDWSK